MKLWSFALLFLANAALAQDSVKLSGKILNPVSDSIIVSYNDNAIAYYPKDFIATVGRGGYFSLAFPIPHGVYTQATIRHRDKAAELILNPGDSIFVSVDAAHFDSTLHFLGRGGAIQNFIAKHTITAGRINQYVLKVKTHINKEPDEFLKNLDNERKIENEFLDKNKTGLPGSFINYWTALFQYYNYFFLEQYPQMHAMIKARKYTDSIPEANYSVVSHLPYAFNDSLLQLSPYLLYLTGVFEIKLKAAGYTFYGHDTATYRKFQDSVMKLVYQHLPPKSTEYYMAQNLYGRARNQPIARTEFMYTDFKKRWPKSGYLPTLDKQMAIAERLAPGQPAPDFDITTPDGRQMKLSDLRGKVVYVNFWASWCKQCVGEIIKEGKMKELIKNKPLEFVYISIDNDTAADNKLIAKYKMEGLFTHAIGEWSAPEVQLYGVQSLPAYFLIDDEGKFAMQNPPPSPLQSTELILALEKLFK